jgi:Ser/Thr protein kinase RdoA (MazF antagonist)
VSNHAPVTRREQIARLRRVAEAALTAYGVVPSSLSLLHHAYNTTFAATSADREREVLHILRQVDADLPEAERRGRIESELWWLERVSADLGLVVPISIRTPEGNGVVSVALDGIEPARICIFRGWVDGRFVRHRLMPAHPAAVGRLTARLHARSAHLHVPDWFERPLVDRADENLEAETADLFGEHVSRDAARVIRRALRQVRRTHEGLAGEPDAFGLIHADIHQGNYLFDRSEVRLIDFGDCGWGHYLYDLAVTLSEVADFPRYDAVRSALLSGYRQVRNLTAAQEAMIDDFILLREVQNLTWFVRARDDPNYRDRAALVGQRIAVMETQLD